MTRDINGRAGAGIELWKALWLLLLRRRRLLGALMGAGVAVVVAFTAGVWSAAQMNAAPGTPIKLWVVEFTKAKPVRALYARVEDARGPVVLTARVDDESLPRWGNASIGTPAPVAFNTFDIATNWHNRCMSRSDCANGATETLGNVFHHQHANIDAGYKAAVETWWKTSVLPAVDPRPAVNLDDVRIADRAPRQLKLEIEPKVPAWHFTVVISEAESSPSTVISRVVIDQVYPSTELPNGRRLVVIPLQ